MSHRKTDLGIPRRSKNSKEVRSLTIFQHGVNYTNPRGSGHHFSALSALTGNCAHREPRACWSALRVLSQLTSSSRRFSDDIPCHLSRGRATPAWWYTKAPYGYERKDASLPFVYLAF